MSGIINTLKKAAASGSNLQRNAGVPEFSPEMRFSIEPLPGDSGFSQWHSAMKMVSQLPEGIPPEFRKRLWLSLADKHLSAKGIDWPKAERNCFSEWSHPADAELGVQIVKDLHRTGCSLFCGKDGQENQALLKRVLLAYARWNKAVGYCQGFNMLAALILQVTEKCEADALKLMIYLIEGVLPDSYFADSLRGLSVDMAVFRELLRTKLPRLSNHLDTLQVASKEGTTSYEPPLTNVFTMQWFLTLFCNCLPQPMVLRVWDLILLEGNEILLRTALAIWQVLAERIMTVKSADEFYCMMGVLMREILEFDLIDANTLVKGIVTIGPLTDLSRLREHYLYNINPWGSAAPTVRVDKRMKVYNKERLVLDIGVLKKQYTKLKQRQRQAHIIFNTAVARQATRPAPVAMNHLLLGKSALVPAKRLGPPKGAVPPARQVKPQAKPQAPPQPPKTLHWKDTRRNSPSSSSSSDTELCDDPENPSSDEESQLPDDNLKPTRDKPLMIDDNTTAKRSASEIESANTDIPPAIGQNLQDNQKVKSDIFDTENDSDLLNKINIQRSDSIQSEDGFDFEKFLEERVRSFKDAKQFSSEESIEDTSEQERVKYARKNSVRALEIIQENSLILHRILQCQSRLTPSPPPVDGKFDKTELDDTTPTNDFPTSDISHVAADDFPSDTLNPILCENNADFLLQNDSEEIVANDPNPVSALDDFLNKYNFISTEIKESQSCVPEVDCNLTEQFKDQPSVIDFEYKSMGLKTEDESGSYKLYDFATSPVVEKTNMDNVKYKLSDFDNESEKNDQMSPYKSYDFDVKSIPIMEDVHEETNYSQYDTKIQESNNAINKPQDETPSAKLYNFMPSIATTALEKPEDSSYNYEPYKFSPCDEASISQSCDIKPTDDLFNFALESNNGSENTEKETATYSPYNFESLESNTPIKDTEPTTYTLYDFISSESKTPPELSTEMKDNEPTTYTLYDFISSESKSATESNTEIKDAEPTTSTLYDFISSESKTPPELNTEVKDNEPTTYTLYDFISSETKSPTESNTEIKDTACTLYDFISSESNNSTELNSEMQSTDRTTYTVYEFLKSESKTDLAEDTQIATSNRLSTIENYNLASNDPIYKWQTLDSQSYYPPPTDLDAAEYKASSSDNTDVCDFNYRETCSASQLQQDLIDDGAESTYNFSKIDYSFLAKELTKFTTTSKDSTPTDLDSKAKFKYDYTSVKNLDDSIIETDVITNESGLNSTNELLDLNEACVNPIEAITEVDYNLDKPSISEVDYNLEKYRYKLGSPMGDVAEEQEMIEVGKNSKYNSILEYSRDLDEKFNNLILRSNPKTLNAKFNYSLDVPEVEKHSEPKPSLSFSDLDTLVEDKSYEENCKRTFNPLPDDENRTDTKSPDDSCSASRKYLDSLGDSPTLKSPSRIYNPFPINISTRQNKEVAVRLGLYKK